MEPSLATKSSGEVGAGMTLFLYRSSITVSLHCCPITKLGPSLIKRYCPSQQ